MGNANYLEIYPDKSPMMDLSYFDGELRDPEILAEDILRFACTSVTNG